MGMTEENWPAAVGIVTGIFAKEAVVGTLNAMYSQIAGVSSTTNDGDEYSLWGGIKTALATIPENLVAIGDSLSDPLGFSVNSAERSDTRGIQKDKEKVSNGGCLSGKKLAHNVQVGSGHTLRFGHGAAIREDVNTDAQGIR
jgi:ferrous iron transport protein B